MNFPFEMPLHCTTHSYSPTKKYIEDEGKKVNVHLTTIERGIEIFSTFFLRKLIRSCNIFARGGSFFITEFFFNEHLNEEIIFTVPELSHFTFDELMDELLCVFFFHNFEHILFLIICIRN